MRAIARCADFTTINPPEGWHQAQIRREGSPQCRPPSQPPKGMVGKHVKLDYQSVNLYQEPSVLRLMTQSIGLKHLLPDATTASQMGEFFQESRVCAMDGGRGVISA